MTITIDSKAFRAIMIKLNTIEAVVKANTNSKWLSEDEAMLLTGLTKNSLYRKRKAFEFNYSTATGRKIKYLRKDIEKYINDNSTITK